jgi:hypothetical protein
MADDGSTAFQLGYVESINNNTCFLNPDNRGNRDMRRVEKFSCTTLVHLGTVTKQVEQLYDYFGFMI